MSLSDATSAQQMVADETKPANSLGNCGHDRASISCCPSAIVRPQSRSNQVAAPNGHTSTHVQRLIDHLQLFRRPLVSNGIGLQQSPSYVASHHPLLAGHESRTGLTLAGARRTCQHQCCSLTDGLVADEDGHHLVGHGCAHSRRGDEDDSDRPSESAKMTPTSLSQASALIDNLTSCSTVDHSVGCRVLQPPERAQCDQCCQKRRPRLPLLLDGPHGPGHNSREFLSTSTNVGPALGSRPISSVKRALFGAVNHDENSRILRRELAKCRREATARWNFDFENGRPCEGKEGRYVWQAQFPVQSDIQPSSAVARPGTTLLSEMRVPPIVQHLSTGRSCGDVDDAVQSACDRRNIVGDFVCSSTKLPCCRHCQQPFTEDRVCRHQHQAEYCGCPRRQPRCCHHHRLGSHGQSEVSANVNVCSPLVERNVCRNTEHRDSVDLVVYNGPAVKMESPTFNVTDDGSNMRQQLKTEAERTPEAVGGNPTGGVDTDSKVGVVNNKSIAVDEAKIADSSLVIEKKSNEKSETTIVVTETPVVPATRSLARSNATRNLASVQVTSPPTPASQGRPQRRALSLARSSTVVAKAGFTSGSVNTRSKSHLTSHQLENRLGHDSGDYANGVQTGLRQTTLGDHFKSRRRLAIVAPQTKVENGENEDTTDVSRDNGAQKTRQRQKSHYDLRSTTSRAQLTERSEAETPVAEAKTGTCRRRRGLRSAKSYVGHGATLRSSARLRSKAGVQL